MVRESPTETSPPDLADTPEGRQVRPYGMLFTAATAMLVIVVAASFQLR